ncbi:hypothetical protein DRF65_27745 [Chryseobacterium pennae]|uniref:LysM domain-containing protein n=1 Tax=Chryseobacterium pennae TaxID=2258962 RepID=A0A3D9C0L6_9FLAO|nr:LysM domain-containing protein [Chryseobacterium pennae]REC59102.1 hypothetical protein DRF65_27745 [Chryseobacterium pennae]
MGLKEYIIQKGDNLKKIAEHHYVSVEELLKFHNENCTLTQQIIGNEIPLHITKILVEFANHKSGERKLSDFKNRKARYRTKQINIVKINDVINTHTSVRCEYLLELKKNQAKVILQDSVYNFYAEGTQDLEQFVRTSDSLKKEVDYQLNSNGEIVEILNLEALQQGWHRFKKQLPLNNLVKNNKPEIIKQLIDAGNIEFGSPDILLKNCKNNLFNQIIFGQYLKRQFDEFTNEQFETLSHFFPEIAFKVECETTVRNTTENQTNFLKKGRPLFVDIDNMILLYEKYYKPQIQFKFTDHIYEYEVFFTVSNEDGLIDEATIHLSERIKNNVESQVVYQLKRVEL